MPYQYSFRIALSLALILGQSACASLNPLPKMEPSRPVDIDHAFFGPRYKQGGRAIDPSDMADRLAESPESASAVKRGRVLNFVSLMLAGIGGGLVGWPLGAKLGGDAHPPWALAYAGAATIAVSLPIGYWGAWSVDSAVGAHNQRVLGQTDEAH